MNFRGLDSSAVGKDIAYNPRLCSTMGSLPESSEQYWPLIDPLNPTEAIEVQWTGTLLRYGSSAALWRREDESLFLTLDYTRLKSKIGQDHGRLCSEMQCFSENSVAAKGLRMTETFNFLSVSLKGWVQKLNLRYYFSVGSFNKKIKLEMAFSTYYYYFFVLAWTFHQNINWT